MTLPFQGTPPTRAHPDDAGLDLRAATDITIPSGAHALVPTGTAVAIPAGHVGMICPRSGLAAKHCVTVLNAPGIIDAGYRGEIGVILINHGRATARISRGDRIAQLVIAPFTHLTPVAQPLDTTGRGAAGFGSTGT